MKFHWFLQGKCIVSLDAEAEIASLNRRLAIRKKRSRYGTSRLDKYRNEILALRKKVATLAALQMWLRDRRIKVEQSTISRWLKKNAQIQ